MELAIFKYLRSQQIKINNWSKVPNPDSQSSHTKNISLWNNANIINFKCTHKGAHKSLAHSSDGNLYLRTTKFRGTIRTYRTMDFVIESGSINRKLHNTFKRPTFYILHTTCVGSISLKKWENIGHKHLYRIKSISSRILNWREAIIDL